MILISDFPSVRRRFSDWLADVAHLMGIGTFSSMPNDKLADHYWAAESALLRAVRCGDKDNIPELHQLARAMERELRRRGRL